jgi:hypothetical protein
VTNTNADIAVEVLTERHRQDERWGQQDHENGTGPAVVVTLIPADAGAARADNLRTWATARCDRAAHHGDITWEHILLEEVFEALAEDDPARLRAELIQVSAVAQSWVSAIDRREAA